MITKTQPIGMRVVVLTNGFVFVGMLYDKDEQDNYKLSNCRNIRVWGTEGRGLGYLSNGPTKQTVTDDVGLLIFPRHALVYWFETDEKAWK